MKLMKSYEDWYPGMDENSILYTMPKELFGKLNLTKKMVFQLFFLIKTQIHSRLLKFLSCKLLDKLFLIHK